MLETLKRGDAGTVRAGAPSPRVRVSAERIHDINKQGVRLKRVLGSAAMVVLLSGCKPAAHRELPAFRPTPMPEIKFQPPNPSGPRRTLEQIEALPDEQFDVAEAILALTTEMESKGAHAAPDVQATLQELDRLAARARADLPDNPDGVDTFDTLYEIVLDRKAAEPYREDRAENYDLPLAVQKHRGSCLSVGIMTLAVARRMGAPIWGVQCPAHFFLKYVPPAGTKNPLSLNFDVTRPSPENWAKLDDDFYRNWHHIDSKAEAAGAYLRPLRDREVVSAYLASRSGYFGARKLFAKALTDAERALLLNPRNVTACVNAGFAAEAMGELVEAERHYKLALKIDPNSVRGMNNMAYLKVRDPDSSVYDVKGAERLIESALRLEPGKALLLATQAEVFAARRDWRAAGRSMQDALKIEPKNAAYRARFMQFREQLRTEK